MPISRRTFLLAVFVSLITVVFYKLFRGKPDRLLVTTLPDFLDTLIPPDQTPSATDLNVDEQVREYLKLNSNYLNIVLFGCIWLDKIANEKFSADFSTLSDHQKEAIVTRLESLKENQTAQLFFQKVKDMAFEFYYSKPESWIGLGIEQPPQPMGYGDYDRAPKNV